MSFTAFAMQYGVLIRDPIPDNRVHRVKTEDHKSKRNGAYRWDGVMGAVRNWATMQDWALYRPDQSARLPVVDMQRVRRMQQEAHAAERKRHTQAERNAAMMVKNATLVKPRAATKWADGVYTHPYLDRKGFKDAHCLLLDRDYSIEREDKSPMVLKAGGLLIPMRDALTDRLLGVQTIYEDGTKLFLPGVRAKCAVFRLGRAEEIWLCEGVATAYSVEAALKAAYRLASVLVCFSASNIVAVAEALRERPGDRFVVADNDPPNPQNPVGAGRAAAEATGLPWVMPDEVGTDLNDLHLSSGLNAARDVLRRIL